VLIIMAKRIESHVLERIITGLMIVFGAVAIFIFVTAFKNPDIAASEIAIIEILLIIVLGILAQTVILIRIYDHASK
jgi:hypothetical protein